MATRFSSGLSMAVALVAVVGWLAVEAHASPAQPLWSRDDRPPCEGGCIAGVVIACILFVVIVGAFIISCCIVKENDIPLEIPLTTRHTHTQSHTHSSALGVIVVPTGG
ncbi:hypothetical protein F4809DRAFT_643682 [Biscogniauxia mediterranea]|nr:hypothetical protein F4809DRAFT_643682 [Biscogniauxia mediterranea]